MHSLVKFDPEIGHYLMKPLRASVDLVALEIKRYSAFTKAPALHGPRHQIFEGVFALSRDAVVEFYRPSRLAPK